MRRFSIIYFMVCVFVFFLASGQPSVARGPEMAEERFPLYGSIEVNVSFWKDIYGRYSLAQGVIHDKENLGRIYEVVSFGEPQKHGLIRKNRLKVKKIKEKYRKILTNLAAGNAPKTSDEKRVFSLFGENPDPAGFAEAAVNLRFQLGQKDRFKQGIIRSGAYLERMQQVFVEYGLPRDLVFLAHVESSFNPMAYSKFGAAGIWQFTRSTGKRFLQVSYTLDERRDPMQATDAAARYLKENFELLGSWPLAITAYNHGAGGIQRALKKNSGYEEIFRNHRGRRFKFASRNFYSEFLAARAVAMEYEKYFGPLKLASAKPGFDVILPGYAPVDVLAKYFRVDEEILKEWNPALREPVFQGQKYIPKGYRLCLPVVEEQLMLLADAMPMDLFFPDQKPSRFHLVRRGETAGKIAQIHKVPLNDLILANQLGRRATIYAGQNLRIPTGEEKVVLLAAAVKTKKAEEQAVLQFKEEKVNSGSLSVESLFKEEQPGEILVEASQVEEKQEIENKTTSIALVNPAVVEGDFLIDLVEIEGDRQIGNIRVLVGETLGHYAEWLGVRAWDIRRLNGLKYGQAIQVNQTLKVPLEKMSKNDFEERRYLFHKEVEEDFFAAFHIAGLETYRVKSGDTIWSLSREEFELPLWLIKKYNSNIDMGRLRAHQQMVVPIVEKISKSSGGLVGKHEKV